MALTTKQRGVARGMAAALAVVCVVIAAVIVLRPLALLPLGSDLAGRLAWAAMWLFLPALALLVAIGRLAGHRFRSPQDIDGSGLTQGSDGARVQQAVIQNTLEQTVLAALVYDAYAASLPRGWLAAIPAAAVLFVVGRMLFATGYGRGAPGRAMGFAMTFYSTALLAAITAVALVLRILGL
jgi:hypothetical protein